MEQVWIPLALLLVWLLALRTRRGSRSMVMLNRFLYAHRGYHDKQNGVPENSMTAFRRAAANGWGAELDVHLTKDGRLAVIHDSSLLRTAGVDLRVETLTAQALRQYRLEGTQETIPFLEEVLAVFEGIAPLVIELKTQDGNHRRLCRTVWKMLEQYRGAYCIESFDPQVALWFHLHQPKVCRGQLSCDVRKGGGQLPALHAFVLKNLLTNFLTVPDFIAYDYHQRENPALWVCRHIWGAQEAAWTVRSLADQQALEAEGALIIFEGYDPRG